MGMVTDFQFPTTAYHLDLMLFGFPLQEFGIQTSTRDILFSVSLPILSCPPCLEYLLPRALILQRLWCNISHITYLLSVLALLCPTSF